MTHKIYRCIVKAVNNGRLKEPFRAKDVKMVCPNFAKNTYSTFLSKHRKGNPRGNSELFIRVSRGLYRLLRPIKYGIV